MKIRIWYAQQFIQAKEEDRKAEMIAFSCLTWKELKNGLMGWGYSTFQLVDVSLTQN
jgi:hypothetical protein